jgi:cytochrome c553
MAIMISLILAGAIGAQTQAGAQKTDMAPRGAAIVAHGTSAGAVACARCHGFDGLSDGSGAFPILANQNASYLSKQLREFTSDTRLNASGAATGPPVRALRPYGVPPARLSA